MARRCGSEVIWCSSSSRDPPTRKPSPSRTKRLAKPQIRPEDGLRSWEDCCNNAALLRSSARLRSRGLCTSIERSSGTLVVTTGGQTDARSLASGEEKRAWNKETLPTPLHESSLQICFPVTLLRGSRVLMRATTTITVEALLAPNTTTDSSSVGVSIFDHI